MFKKYPIVAVDVVIFTVKDGKLQAILIKMKKKPFTGKWAFPGGRVGLKKSLDEAARRELFEKTGVKNIYLEQLYAFGDVKRDPFDRVVSVAYFALVNAGQIKKLETTSKYAGINWFNVKHLPKLAYDHKEMARLALGKLRARLGYMAMARVLLPKFFSLGELQKIYEIILDKKLDKRNFRRKMFALGIIKPAGKKRGDVPYRPAALYKFI